MRTQIAKWGHSLAVRIPAEYARAAGLQAGDPVELAVTASGEISLVPIGKSKFDKSAFLAALDTLHADMPMTQPVVEQMRREARY